MPHDRRVGIVHTIQNFMPVKDAKEMADFIEHEMPPEWWFLSTYPHGDFDAHVSLTQANAVTNTHKRNQANAAFAKGNFSYCFKRTCFHPSHCHCRVCKWLSGMLLGDAIRTELQDKHDIQYTRIVDAYASCYGRGDFVTPHTDDGIGKYKFFWDLSDGVNPRHGGQLQMVDGGVIDYAFPPMLNTLFVIPIAENNEFQITHVAPDCGVGRFGIEGWLS